MSGLGTRDSGNIDDSGRMTQTSVQFTTSAENCSSGKSEPLVESYDNAAKTLTASATLLSFFFPCFNKRATKSPYKKSFKDLVVFIPIQLFKILHLIIYLPFTLIGLLGFYKSKTIQQVEEDIAFYGYEGNIYESVMEENYQYFWKCTDISSEQVAEYEERLGAAHRNYSANDSMKLMLKELEEVCKNNYSTRLGSWLKVVTYPEYPEMTESVFKLLHTNIMQGYMSCPKLLSKLPPNCLVDLSINSGPLTGYNIIHFSIMNQKLELFQAVLNRIPLAKLDGLLNTSGCSALGLEQPLLLAVYMADKRAVTILIEAGAELVSQDSAGKNVFHVCVDIEKFNPQTAVDVFETIMSLIDVWIEKTVSHEFLRDMTLRCRRQYTKWMLLRAVNRNGLTPLQYAALEGATEILSHIIEMKEVYCFPHKQLGPLSTNLYDVSEIDSFLTERNTMPSVAELVVMAGSTKTLNCLKVEPIATLIKIKWDTFHPILLSWGVSHVLYLLIITAIAMTSFLKVNKSQESPVGNFPNTEVNTSLTLFAMQLNNGKKTLAEYSIHLRGLDELLTEVNSKYEELVILQQKGGANITGQGRYVFQDYDYLTLVNAIGYTAISVLITYSHIQVCLKITRSKGIALYSDFTFLRLENISLYLYPTFTFAYLLLKVSMNEWYLHMFAFSLLFGWLILLIYMRAFKSLNLVGVMLSNVLRSDALQFVFVLLIFNCAAAAFACTVLVSVTIKANAEFRSEKMFQMTLGFVKLGIGLADNEDLYLINDKFDIFLLLVYIFFIIFVNVTLLNMLIAAMSDSYSQTSSIRELLSIKLRMADMVLLERMFPVFIQKYVSPIKIHKVIRFTLPNGKNVDYHVYLLPAPSNAARAQYESGTDI